MPLFDPLDSRDVGASAVSARDLSSFASDLLERCQRAIGFDVAYHAPVGAVRQFAATCGLSSALAARMLGRGDTYTRELMPVKRAALGSGGVAVDSEVFSARAQALLSYFREAMAPDGGRHMMLALGVVGGDVVSVTMLGRTGSAFSCAQMEALRGVVPIVGLATAAHVAQQRSNPGLGSGLD